MPTDPGHVSLMAGVERGDDNLTLQHLLSQLRNDARDVECAILGDGRDAISLTVPAGFRSQPLAAIVLMDAQLPDRIDALLRLWAGLRGKRTPPDPRITSQQRQRLRRMLQAGDGHCAGAHYREIAIALYGAARVEAQPWKTSSLRDAVIALVKDAQRMTEGDYRTLLRRRRPSLSRR